MTAHQWLHLVFNDVTSTISCISVGMSCFVSTDNSRNKLCRYRYNIARIARIERIERPAHLRCFSCPSSVSCFPWNSTSQIPHLSYLRDREPSCLKLLSTPSDSEWSPVPTIIWLENQLPQRSCDRVRPLPYAALSPFIPDYWSHYHTSPLFPLSNSSSVLFIWHTVCVSYSCPRNISDPFL